MANVLYEHNQTAYQNVCRMLQEKGRAAVIHPTGTGKSFIAFQLCADHPDKTVCWLSPSEYIFRTQRENWEEACRTALTEISDGGMPDIELSDKKIFGDCYSENWSGSSGETTDRDGQLWNIRFLTYARLMLMGQEELASLKPDYIVLDEFHRCGAKMWGQGVQRLLAQYPEAPVLGLTATSIRYLDGQRDMADELFDGNVASELTLGESIVRGILNPPKYVLSLYSWQKELDKFRERAKKAKSKAVRAEAEKYLEALRRALEKAEGLDEIFYKHIAGQPARNDRYGKYLVFCADYDHMQEMIAKVPEWFHKVDREPHVYSVYSEDPQSEQSFTDFKADESDHLKLLFCIDMLNEGIHVDDVSGVILLRPTVSPIIYKQQIGRALSAGKKKNAVIFDVVMNIENLYSIGTLEAEMQTVVSYYHSHGMGDTVVNEHFRIIDEVQDCMRLFNRLNETLGASWELMYRAAERYYEEHGDVEAPKRYITEDGYSLGQWLDTQRKVRAGKVKGNLSDSQIEKLDRLGMRWQGKADASWEKYFTAAKQYYEEHGDLLVPGDAEYGSVKLGKWIAQLREERKVLTARKKGKLSNGNIVSDAESLTDSGTQDNRGNTEAPGSRKLTKERIHALEAIGMIWDVPDYRWEQNFRAAENYYTEHGDLNVPYYYTDKDGVKLGVWIYNMRAVRQGKDIKRSELTKNRICRLDKIGMAWENRWDTAWERSYREACRYRDEHGDLNIPTTYKTEEGMRLGRWIRHQRDACRGEISEERRKKLEKLGI